MTELIFLFQISDGSKLKQVLALLVRSKDLKVGNTLLGCNQNTLMFNTRKLNEEILCKDKHFPKRNMVM